MWAVKNRTPFKALGTWGRDKDGVHEWIVAVKGTFDIRPDGEIVIAEEQLEPLLAPQYNGEAGLSSLRYEADAVGPKATTDILLNGTAYAPKGRPSVRFEAGLRVGPMHKVIEVHGHRTWVDGIFGAGSSAAEPITQLAIAYENAYGGLDDKDADPANRRMDSRNPVGRGIVGKGGSRSGMLQPNLAYPGASIESAGPAGFGPIDSFWSPRRELSGTYDPAWFQDRRPLLPADWHPDTLLCSPADQRPRTHLRGGESVELVNLTPGGRLGFELPKIELDFNTRLDGRIEEHEGHLSTVIIEPDHARVLMVWVSCLRCRTDVDYLDQTVIHEKLRRR